MIYTEQLDACRVIYVGVGLQLVRAQHFNQQVPSRQLRTQVYPFGR